MEEKSKKKRKIKKPAKKIVKPAKPTPRPAEKPRAKALKYAPQENLLRWQAPDYYTFEKSPYWSLIVGLIAIVASLVLIYTENYFPVIIVILAVIVTFQVSHEKPKAQEFAVDEGGILSRNAYIPYIELKSFWVASHGNKSILYLETISRLRGPIVIPLGQTSASEIRVFLLRYLPERQEYGEMFSEKLMRIFRL